MTPFLELSTTIAADYYDSRGKPNFAKPGLITPVDALQITARWAMTTGDADTGLKLLIGGSQKFLFDVARDTVTSNVKRERGARWARRLGGTNPCDFCRMLAGRGAVYHHDPTEFDYHDNCSCTPVPYRP